MKLTKSYKSWLTELKQNISQVRLQTSMQVNANMLLVYWYIGKQILEKQELHGWGAKVVEVLAQDLQKAFPDTKGFSVRNLKYMRRFVELYSPTLEVYSLPKNKKTSIVQTVSAQLENSSANLIVQTLSAQLGNSSLFNISWSHHVLLMDKAGDTEERLWYIKQSIENGWSVRVLDYQISTSLYKRQHKKQKSTNFHLTLPKEHSDLANQILKDPYNFDFLQISKDTTERELEIHLTNHIQQFLLELGAGFAYVGRQFKLKLGRKEYFLDLLFYHLHLRCFIVIELKMGEFEPEFAGKMNAYLNALNKEYKKPHDNPSIGIILCNSKDEIEVEYALQGLQHPIGVSEYKTIHALPKNLRDKLPSVKQLKDAIKEFNRQQKSNISKSKRT
jgi:predicted nuclease of restriction endonuclease-like (RecB) superfamily